MTFGFAFRDIFTQWNVHFACSFSTLAGIHRYPEQFWKSIAELSAEFRKIRTWNCVSAALALWFGFFCGYVVTFRFMLPILYTPLFWARFSFSYNMTRVISRMIQGLTLASKYVKARQKNKLQKRVLRGTVSVSHFFDPSPFSSIETFVSIIQMSRAVRKGN